MTTNHQTYNDGTLIAGTVSNGTSYVASATEYIPLYLEMLSHALWVRNYTGPWVQGEGRQWRVEFQDGGESMTAVYWCDVGRGPVAKDRITATYEQWKQIKDAIKNDI